MFSGNDKKTHFEKDYWPSKKSLISPDYSCVNYILVVSYDDVLYGYNLYKYTINQ